MSRSTRVGRAREPPFDRRQGRVASLPDVREGQSLHVTQKKNHSLFFAELVENGVEARERFATLGVRR